MSNSLQNQSENPFQGINAAALQAFFQNEDKYNTVMELLFCIEQALHAPVPPYTSTDLDREYWHLMNFVTQQGLAGEFVQFRAALKRKG